MTELNPNIPQPETKQRSYKQGTIVKVIHGGEVYDVIVKYVKIVEASGYYHFTDIRACKIEPASAKRDRREICNRAVMRFKEQYHVHSGNA